MHQHYGMVIMSAKDQELPWCGNAGYITAPKSVPMNTKH